MLGHNSLWHATRWGVGGGEHISLEFLNPPYKLWWYLSWCSHDVQINGNMFWLLYSFIALLQLSVAYFTLFLGSIFLCPPPSPPPFFIRYRAPNYPFLSTPKKCWQSFNPLTPRSDQLPISPYNITSESNMVMRIKEMIFNLLSSWFLNKFSLSVLQEMYRA